MPKNKFLLLSGLWFMATIYLLLKAPSGEPPPFTHFDKLGHFVLFFGQFWLLSKLFFTDHKPVPVLYLSILVVVWAILSEVMQGVLTQDRNADVWDAAADVLGGMLAIALGRYVGALKIKLHEEKAKALSVEDESVY